MNKLTLTSALASLALAFTALAHAETMNCTAITFLPYTITTQGVYCFTGNLNMSTTSGHAITINTNNVVLDLNGFKLGGLAAGPATLANGIYAFQRQNITIKNGTVRGFFRGIFLADVDPFTTSQGHVIEDIRADQNTLTGLFIGGKGNIIRNNQVVATGGSTAFASPSAIGIETSGSGTQVLNNMVTEVTVQGTVPAWGVRMNTASNSVVAGNRVGNITSSGGLSLGMDLSSGSNIIVSDNRLSSMQYGIYFVSGATGKYFSNVTQGVTTPYTGGTAAGTTNY